MARKRYLKKTPLAEAREMLLALVDPTALAIEEIAVDDALDRVTDGPIFARISSPHYHASAMDGICVRAEDTFGATEFAGKKLALAKSETPAPGAFQYVDTGNALPPWANAVVMIEKVRQLDDGTVEIFESVAPWNHVRLVGEDVVATELLLPRSHRLRPYDLGALLAAGHIRVRVKARPRVGIIPTGDELIQPGEEVKPGAVIDFNSTVLAAFVREWGGAPIKYPRAHDDLAKLMQALRHAAEECDLVAIIAGSSAGEHDLTADVVGDSGELLAHGIDVMPGKPAVLGRVQNRPVIGVPGYPVSAIVIAREILRPALEKFLGSAAAAHEVARAVVPKKIASHLGLEEFLRVTLGRVGAKLVAVPLARGAGVITTMVHADGLLRIPSLVEGLNAGDEAEVELLRPIKDIENTILCTGSHDLARPGIRFVNRQPGSGTRVLLDCELKKLDLDPASIDGYDREEFTHMAVGVAVASGLVDAGLGVRAAATALGLDFILVASEQYDLLVARAFFESERGELLMEIIRSDGFKRAVAALGGYDTRRAGEVLYQQ